MVRLVNTKIVNQEDVSHDTQSLPVNLLYQLNKGDAGEDASDTTPHRKVACEQVLVNHVP